MLGHCTMEISVVWLWSLPLEKRDSFPFSNLRSGFPDHPFHRILTLYASSRSSISTESGESLKLERKVKVRLCKDIISLFKEFRFYATEVP